MYKYYILVESLNYIQNEIINKNIKNNIKILEYIDNFSMSYFILDLYNQLLQDYKYLNNIEYYILIFNKCLETGKSIITSQSTIEYNLLKSIKSSYSLCLNNVDDKIEDSIIFLSKIIQNILPLKYIDCSCI